MGGGGKRGKTGGIAIESANADIAWADSESYRYIAATLYTY
jgi:hypothetical protein